MFKEPDETGYKMPIGKNRVHADKEAARKAHIERVKLWNKENPEKFKEYQKTYQERHKEERSRKSKEKYKNMSSEQREKVLSKQREYYYRKKAERDLQ